MLEPAGRNGRHGGSVDKDGDGPRELRDASASPTADGLPAGLERPELPT